LIRDAAGWSGLTSGKWARTRLVAAAKEETPDPLGADTPSAIAFDESGDEDD
jgi:hypothetical protein